MRCWSVARHAHVQHTWLTWSAVQASMHAVMGLPADAVLRRLLMQKTNTQLQSTPGSTGQKTEELSSWE